MSSTSPEPLQALADALELGPAEGVLNELRAIYAEVDEEVRVRAQGADLPCRAGCDACCKESVFLSGPEFFLVVAQLLQDWPKPEIETLLARMGALAERFADELELLESMEPGWERDEVAARVKFECPFLLEHRCRIYAVRELNARTFGASWDHQRREPYGCALTHERLRVLPAETGPALSDARAMRAKLAARLPATLRVHVYPWWFQRYRGLIEPLVT